MTKTQFGKEVGLSSPTLARMGKGKYINLESLERICHYFGCQLNEAVEISCGDGKVNEKR